MTTPAVSVLINTYNHERFIAQCLQSVLDQTFPADQMEIIAVDDGSTDRTPEIIRQFGPRIRLIEKNNGGQVSAFNAAVPLARGEIVAFLDGDDWWAGGKLRAVLDVFDKEPDTTAVGHGFIRVHEGTNTHEPFVPAQTYRLTLDDPDAARFAYSARPFFSTSKLAVRREALVGFAPLPQNLIFFDVSAQLLAIAAGSGVVLNQPLCFYRLHQKNLYESSAPDTENLRRKHQYIAAQLDFLPGALAKAGISPQSIKAFLSPDRIARDRLRLILEGGWPWETFRIERAALRMSYERYGTAYAVYKALILASTLFMPPRSFYRARDWYTKHNLRRLRSVLGEPVPVPAIRARP